MNRCNLSQNRASISRHKTSSGQFCFEFPIYLNMCTDKGERERLHVCTVLAVCRVTSIGLGLKHHYHHIPPTHMCLYIHQALCWVVFLTPTTFRGLSLSLSLSVLFSLFDILRLPNERTVIEYAFISDACHNPRTLSLSHAYVENVGIYVCKCVIHFGPSRETETCASSRVTRHCFFGIIVYRYRARLRKR